MAKGNLLIGTASRSIGDVTMYRRNGQQISRARVRKIANPKTEGQAKQRMLMAALTRFYSPLAVCLEKSFEGKNKADSYSQFLKVNATIGKDFFAVPKNAGFVPVPVKVSAGTMPSPVISYNETSDAGFVLNCTADSVNTLGDLSTALINGYGLSEGDQVTVIAVKTDGLAEGETFTPSYFRFFLKPSSVDALPSFNGVSFEVPGELLAISEVDDRLVACAVIFSRYENGSWRRSNSFMALGPTLEADYTGAGAIAKWLPTWMGEDVVPVSDVYLNGSTVSPLTPHAGSATVSLNGTTYTFVAAGYRNIGGTDYAYLVTSEGDRKYIKNNNERSDNFGKFATLSSMQQNDVTATDGTTTAPAGVETADILPIDNHDAAYTAAIAELLVEFAAAHGWTGTGAVIWFGKY